MNPELRVELDRLLTDHGLVPDDLPRLVDAARHTPQAVPRALFETTSMRQALANRDVAGLFRQLQRHGVSQRRIAALTGMSQSEVSEILATRRDGQGRQVASVDVLTRIVSGLGLPLAWAGLAHDDESLTYVTAGRPAQPVPTARAWTGADITPLRGALGLSVDQLAQTVGVKPRLARSWEQAPSRRPRPANQAALDTLPAAADPEARQRFHGLVRKET